jgi:uncharacterized protein
VTRALVLAAALTLAVAASAHAAPTHYATMSDGASIALNVKVPEHCSALNRCPAYFEMSGYESGSDDGKTPIGDVADATGLDQLPAQTGTREAHASHFEDRYVTVLANLRGTGCASGEFDLFSWRSALDGREVIDNWIARQPWSNGDVAIFGHSYSGLTGMMVASTRPRHLRAVSASGLIGDLYRDIVYPGGVTNYGFPLLWTGAVRPVYDIGGGTAGGLIPPESTSAQCAANQAGRSRAILEDPLIHGLDDTGGEWYRTRSLVTYVDRIQVPVHITAAYQDEQTGGRGPTNVFDHLAAGIPKRLVLVNGEHGTQTDPHLMKDRAAWLDHWLLGQERPEFAGTSSRVLLGYQGEGKVVGEIASDGFPLGQTQFTDVFMTAGNELTFGTPEAGTASWVNGSRRQSYTHLAGSDTGGEIMSPTGPDELELSMPFDQPTAIAGPIIANLFVASSAPDTELFVQLIDRAPDGSMLYLNRGMLRASHRQIDESQSQFTADGRIYRPWRPHAERSLVAPGEVVDYLIDVFPVGHVFLPGHELGVKVHAPPLDDNDYAYVQKTLPGVNTLHFGPDTPSRLMLPIVAIDQVSGFQPPPGPCAYAAMRCVQGGAR